MKRHQNNINQIKVGTILSYLQIGFGILIQLVFTPVMIQCLGASEYGLYNTVSSTISMLGILSLGFNAGYLRYYSIYKKNEDKFSIQKLNGLMLLIFIFIGFVGLICGTYLSFHLNIVFDTGLTDDEYDIARILMLMLTANLTISFPTSVFQNIISAHERFVFLKIIGMIKTICSPLITLPLLLSGFRSITLVMVTVALSIIADGLYIYYVLFIMKERFIFRGFEKGLLRSVFNYTAFIAINSIIDQINWNIDKMLLARFKGTGQVAIYSVGYTLYQCYMNFSSSISGFFSPRVHRIVNETNNVPLRQRKELTNLFVKVGRLQFILLGLVSSGFFFFGKFFIIHIWAGGEYESSYWVALLLIIPASVALIQNIGIEIQRAENKHQFRSIAYAVMALLNLGVSIYLCKIYGAVGSAIGTAISLIVANGFIMNIYYQKKCNIDVISFWQSIGKLSKGLIIPVLAGLILSKCIIDMAVFTFIILIFAYIVVYCTSMWFFGMNDYERSLIASPVKKLLQRGKL